MYFDIRNQLGMAHHERQTNRETECPQNLENKLQCEHTKLRTSSKTHKYSKCSTQNLLYIT